MTPIRKENLQLYFYNNTPTSATYTLSLHDALPISPALVVEELHALGIPDAILILLDDIAHVAVDREDRKSTRLNSSHRTISYAVFCLKKKKEYQLALDS